MKAVSDKRQGSDGVTNYELNEKEYYVNNEKKSDPR
jgi:hypothetical protein